MPTLTVRLEEQQRYSPRPIATINLNLADGSMSSLLNALGQVLEVQPVGSLKAQIDHPTNSSARENLKMGRNATIILAVRRQQGVRQAPLPPSPSIDNELRLCLIGVREALNNALNNLEERTFVPANSFNHDVYRQGIEALSKQQRQDKQQLDEIRLALAHAGAPADYGTLGDQIRALGEQVQQLNHQNEGLQEDLKNRRERYSKLQEKNRTQQAELRRQKEENSRLKNASVNNRESPLGDKFRQTNERPSPAAGRI